MIIGLAYSFGQYLGTIEARIQRLEDERCPCRDYFQRWPPEAPR